MRPCRETIRPNQRPGPSPVPDRDPEDTAASAGDILAAVDRAEPLKIVFVRALMVPSLVGRACRGSRRARCPKSALLSQLAGALRLQLLDPRIGALERLILNQRHLHERVDCVRRPSQSIRD